MIIMAKWNPGTNVAYISWKKNLNQEIRPNGDRTLDPLDEMQRQYSSTTVNPTKYPLAGLLSLELWMHALRSESPGLKYERKVWFWVGTCVSVVQW